jgi:hypothetical protein
MSLQDSDSDLDSDIELDDCFIDLDTSWIDDFDAIDNEYKSYYSESLEFINMNCIYLNAANEIINVHEEKVIFLNKGILSREEVVGLIKRNSIINDKDKDKFYLLSILVFNINIAPENLKTFFKLNKENSNNKEKEKEKDIGSQYLHSIKNIDAIVFDKSISLFHDINNLYLVFYKKDTLVKKNGLTKRRFLSSFTKTKRKHEKTI